MKMIKHFGASLALIFALSVHALGAATPGGTPTFEFRDPADNHIQGTINVTDVDELDMIGGYQENGSDTLSNDISGNAATATTASSTSGNAATATALAANGSNCSPGEAPEGVDASGAVENCTDYETNTEATAHEGNSSAHHTATVNTDAESKCTGTNVLEGSGSCVANAGSGGAWTLQETKTITAQTSFQFDSMTPGVIYKVYVDLVQNTANAAQYRAQFVGATDSTYRSSAHCSDSTGNHIIAVGALISYMVLTRDQVFINSPFSAVINIPTENDINGTTTFEFANSPSHVESCVIMGRYQGATAWTGFKIFNTAGTFTGTAKLLKLN